MRFRCSRVPAADAALALELERDRLDAVEVAGDARLVVAEQHALREDVGEELEPLEAARLDDQRALDQPLRAALVHAHLEILDLDRAVPVLDERREPLAERVLAFRRPAEQDRDPVPEQHRDAVARQAHGERQPRERFAFGPVADLQPRPEQKRARPERGGGKERP